MRLTAALFILLGSLTFAVACGEDTATQADASVADADECAAGKGAC